MDELFRKKAEECLDLAKRAVDKEDRAFWHKLALSWQERLRQLELPSGQMLLLTGLSEGQVATVLQAGRAKDSRRSRATKQSLRCGLRLPGSGKPAA